MMGCMHVACDMEDQIFEFEHVIPLWSHEKAEAFETGVKTCDHHMTTEAHTRHNGDLI